MKGQKTDNAHETSGGGEVFGRTIKNKRKRKRPDNKVTFCYSGYTLKGIYFQKGKFSKNFKKEMK